MGNPKVLSAGLSSCLCVYVGLLDNNIVVKRQQYYFWCWKWCP